MAGAGASDGAVSVSCPRWHFVWGGTSFSSGFSHSAPEQMGRRRPGPWGWGGWLQGGVRQAGTGQVPTETGGGAEELLAIEGLLRINL